MGNMSALYFCRLPLFNSAYTSLFANAHQLNSAAIIKNPIYGRNKHFHCRENCLRKYTKETKIFANHVKKGTIKTTILITLDFDTFLRK
jgi:hypothetical protein